jgi:hypothetical protein
MLSGPSFDNSFIKLLYLGESIRQFIFNTIQMENYSHLEMEL